MVAEIADLDTPCLVVDLDVFDANVARCMERLAGVHVRPHLKTAKSPAVARRLLAAGAKGICVAKVSEADVMLEEGIDDVLITTEIAGQVKTARFAALARKHPGVTVVIDSLDAARVLDAALRHEGAGPVGALIDVNVGQDRCGVAPGEAAALANGCAPLTALRICGVQGYEGNLQHIRDAGERRRRCDEAMGHLAAAARDLRAAGHAVEVVTTGGTGTAEFCAAHEVVTEVQPGSFAFMDADYLATGGVEYRSALIALATVVSHPTPERAVVDAGLKTLSDDSGPAVSLEPGWTYRHAGDEHGILDRGAGARELRIGDRVALMPSHIDTTINLHDVLHAHRGGAIEETWPVSGRGKVQ